MIACLELGHDRASPSCGVGMSGLIRFDFYPRDWFLDTRDLSVQAKGCYIDLLAAMYNRGGPLPYDEKYLCTLTGHRQVRPLRRLVDELVSKGKIKVIDGHLVNNRVQEELARAQRRQEIAAFGGRAKARKNTSFDEVSTKFRANFDETLSKPRTGIEPFQGVNPCSPSSFLLPPVSNKKKCAAGGEAKHQFSPNDTLDDDATRYAFEGEVIRLNKEHLETWRLRYHAIPDLEAELAGLDSWYVGTDTKKGKGWFHRAQRSLNEKHQERLSAKQAQANTDNGDTIH